MTAARSFYLCVLISLLSVTLWGIGYSEKKVKEAPSKVEEIPSIVKYLLTINVEDCAWGDRSRYLSKVDKVLINGIPFFLPGEKMMGQEQLYLSGLVKPEKNEFVVEGTFPKEAAFKVKINLQAMHGVGERMVWGGELGEVMISHEELGTPKVMETGVVVSKERQASMYMGDLFQPIGEFTEQDKEAIIGILDDITKDYQGMMEGTAEAFDILTFKHKETHMEILQKQWDVSQEYLLEYSAEMFKKILTQVRSMPGCVATRRPAEEIEYVVSDKGVLVFVRSEAGKDESPFPIKKKVISCRDKSGKETGLGESAHLFYKDKQGWKLFNMLN